MILSNRLWLESLLIDFEYFELSFYPNQFYPRARTSFFVIFEALRPGEFLEARLLLSKAEAYLCCNISLALDKKIFPELWKRASIGFSWVFL